MEPTSGKTILQLVYRLNDLMKERTQLEMAMNELDKEYNAIVYELWGRIPSLKTDENIQPKVKVKDGRGN